MFEDHSLYLDAGQAAQLVRQIVTGPPIAEEFKQDQTVG